MTDKNPLHEIPPDDNKRSEPTNGDILRAMTDEQLAIFLDYTGCRFCNNIYPNCNVDESNKNCFNGRLAWLKQAKEGK